MADLSFAGRVTNGYVCGALVVLVIALREPATLPLRAAEPSAKDNADELFRRQRWAEARSAYDAAAKGLERESRRFREATCGGVQASLRLKDWDDALARATALIPEQNPGQHGSPFGWRPDLGADEQWQAALLHIEFARQLLDQIATASRETGGDFPSRLTTARIAVDQDLAEHLDPESEPSRWQTDSELPHVNWWWDGVPGAREDIDSDERHPRWYVRVGIALTHDGQPVFLEAPQVYEACLPRAKKLLFVLTEIERLDDSQKRNAAAAALLARARLMRRLYGPQTDDDWSSADFYYRNDQRPSFVPTRASAGVKETWELADDEARTDVGDSPRVVVLPASHSPLALLKRLERDYPQSDSVPHALHERGQYYQSRRQFAKALEAYRQEIKQFPSHPLVEKAKQQVGRIEHADVLLGKTGIYASGLAPKLWFACRNAVAV